MCTRITIETTSQQQSLIRLRSNCVGENAHKYLQKPNPFRVIEIPSATARMTRICFHILLFKFQVMNFLSELRDRIQSSRTCAHTKCIPFFCDRKLFNLNSIWTRQKYACAGIYFRGGQWKVLFSVIESKRVCTADYGELSAFFQAEAHCVCGSIGSEFGLLSRRIICAQNSKISEKTEQTFFAPCLPPTEHYYYQSRRL